MAKEKSAQKEAKETNKEAMVKSPSSIFGCPLSEKMQDLTYEDLLAINDSLRESQLEKHLDVTEVSSGNEPCSSGLG